MAAHALAHCAVVRKTQGGKPLFAKTHKTPEKVYTRLLTLHHELLRGDCGILQFDLIVLKRIVALLGTTFNLFNDYKKAKQIMSFSLPQNSKRETNGPPQKHWSKQMREK